jgi:acetate---CoA ligase (ADP-forming) subunit beta
MPERFLNEIESKALLARAHVPVVPTALARTPVEAGALADRLGLPAVVKIVSADVVHKSDVGGVRLNLETAAAVEAASSAMIETVRKARPSARIEGVAVQPMAPAGGIEVIVGVKHDPQFRAVMMFGLGGVLVEVFADVVFRLIPLTRRDARQMIREIRGARLLQGVRGRAAVDANALEDLLLAVSAVVEQHPGLLEIDLNPVFAYPDRAVAVDARILLREPA